MIVEFVGAPGSGKSTLVTASLGWLHSRGVQAEAITGHNVEGVELEHRRRLVRLIVRVGRWMATPRLALASIPRLTDRDAGLELLRLHRREVYRQRLQPEGILILDEGPLHKVVMMAAAQRVRGAMALVDSLSQPDLCVALDVDPQTALERIRGRPPTCNLDREDDATVVAYVSRYLDAYEQLLANLSCSVFRVDSTTPDAAERIAARIAGEGVASCTSPT